MSCDIIIPVWNQLKFTKECIESILKNTRYPYKLIIIDNGSDKRTMEYLAGLKAELDACLIRNEENLGFVKAVNQGFRESKAPYICIMNNDTVATDGWLSEMIEIADLNKDIGLVNPSSNNLGQHKKEFTIDGYADKLKPLKGEFIEMGSCVGFCMVIKRAVFEKLGYLDEVYREGNFDDTDYSRKAEREGYLCVRAKGSYVYHHMKSSFLKRGDYKESFRRNQEIYNKRWGAPRRFLYIITKDHGKLFDWMKRDVLKKARRGDWVWLYFPAADSARKDGLPAGGWSAYGGKKTEDLPQLVVHSNVKLICLPHIFFEWNCLAKIIKKKKRFDSIYADDPNLLEKIKRLDRFHKAETILMGG